MVYMKLSTRLPFFLATSLLVVTASAIAGTVPSKSPVQPIQEPEPFYLPGTFNTGVKTSDVYTEGHISLVVPLWSTLGADGTLGGGYLFLEPYTSLGEQGELANSVGLGWRYLFNDQPVSALQSDASASLLTEGFYVGANVFVDNLRTQFDNDFWQLGIGAEIGSRYLELRGNYYLPFDGSQKLAERSTSSRSYTSRSRSQRSSSSTSYNTQSAQATTPTGAPFATGNSIQQDVNLTDLAVTSATTTTRTTTYTTTTKTTIKTITSLFEEGMEGWDVEAAVLIPGLDKYLDVTLLAGYYSFDNQPFGPQRGGSGETEGWKLGVEIRPVPAIVLTGTWYEDEGLTGSDWVVGAGLQIPLGREWKDAFKSRRRHLAERLAEPVARQNAAIKTSRSYDVDHEVSQTSKTTAKTSSNSQTAIVQVNVTNTPGRITIAEDVIFVNNGGAVGNGIAQAGATQTGTAEQPFDTVQKGADLAGTRNANTKRVWNVYTQGAGAHGGTTYAESVLITGSTNFISSRTGILSPLAGGGAFGTGDTPEVVGGFAGQNAFLPGYTEPSFVGIRGYEISGGYNAALNTSANIPGPGLITANGMGIGLFDVDNVVITGNIIHDLSVAAISAQHTTGPMNASITGNDIRQITGQGIYVFSNGSITGEVSENTLNNLTSNGIVVVGGNNTGSSFTGNVLRNSVNTVSGFGIFLATDTFTGDVTGNRTENTTVAGLGIGGIDFIGNVTKNTTLSSSGTAGLAVTTANSFTGNISENYSALNSNGVGYLISAPTFTGDISSNEAYQNGLVGISLTATSFTGSIVGNTSNQNNGTGIYASVGTFTGNVTNNTANSNVGGSSSGIAILATGDFIGNITDNTTNLNGFSGLGVSAVNFTGDFSRNEASDNILSNGFSISTSNVFKGNIANNDANDNGTFGMITQIIGSFTGDLTENTTNKNQVGIHFTVGGDVNTVFRNNTANENTFAGFGGITLIGYSVLNADFINNTANDNEGWGFFVQNPLGAVTADFSNNFANDNGSSGITISAVTFSGDFTENQTSGNTGGIYVAATQNITSTATGNVANNNTSAINGGIHLISTGGVLDVSVNSNFTSGNTNSGILLQQSTGAMAAEIRDNTSHDNGAAGIAISGVDFAGDLLRNNAGANADGTNQYGVFITLSGDMTATVTGNTTNQNSNIGFFMNAASFFGAFNNNTANGNTLIGFGTNVGSANGSPRTPNTATGNGVQDIFNVLAPVVQ